MTFGETMRAERKACRIPQKELAQMLGQSYQMVATIPVLIFPTTIPVPNLQRPSLRGHQ